jgi:uncharacterized membrane protein YedE/YeeE
MNALYQAICVETWPWWVGGPAIGLFVLAFMIFQNRLLTASASFQGVIEALQGKGDPEKDAFGMKTEVGDLPVEIHDPAPRWRVWFFCGLILGGLVSGLIMGNWGSQAGLEGLGDFLKLGPPGQMLALAIGGICIGFGTRFCGGCTSGHAIVGISGRQWPSLVATAIFFGAGMATTFLIHWLRP